MITHTAPLLTAGRREKAAHLEMRVQQRPQVCRPRLIIVAQLPPPAHGAALVNNQVVNSQRLATAFDVTVVPISMIGDLRRIRRFELGKVARSLGLYWSIVRLLRATHPNLVYLTLSPKGWAFYRDFVMVALLRLFGVRHVLHLHGRGVAAAARAPWRRALYRFAFARAYVIVLGELLCRDVDAVAGRDRIFIVPNGVPDMRAAEHSVLRSGAHLKGRVGAPKVLFLSNMLATKGPLVLLDALGVLARRNVAFSAVFAGAWVGDISTESFFERVRMLGLESRVIHLGPLQGKEKNEAFSQADVFALPTYNDALPLAVIEAMMHGLPVVTTHIGALPEIIASGETGELIEPKNVTALALALDRLLASTELRMRYGAAARARYEADLTDTQFDERLVDLLRCLATTANK